MLISRVISKILRNPCSFSPVCIAIYPEILGIVRDAFPLFLFGIFQLVGQIAVCLRRL